MFSERKWSRKKLEVSNLLCVRCLIIGAGVDVFGFEGVVLLRTS